MMLLQALREVDLRMVCQMDHKNDNQRCHSEKELIRLGANKFKNPWTTSFREKKDEKFIVEEQQRRDKELELREREAQRPDPNFRNNTNDSGPALVMELFPRLPLEIRNMIWQAVDVLKARIITIDADNQSFSKIVQVLPEHPDSHSNNPVFPKNVLHQTTRESREAAIDIHDGFIYVDSTMVSGPGTRKIQFSNKLGDLVFINTLKVCAHSLKAAGFRDGVEGSFAKNLTSLAIHDRNFFLWGLGATDEDTEFAIIANLLSKFTELEHLWIVLAPSNKKLNLTTRTELKIVALPQECQNHSSDRDDKCVMRWSVRAMTPVKLHSLFAAYALKHKEWKMPAVRFMRVASQA